MAKRRDESDAAPDVGAVGSIDTGGGPGPGGQGRHQERVDATGDTQPNRQGPVLGGPPADVGKAEGGAGDGLTVGAILAEINAWPAAGLVPRYLRSNPGLPEGSQIKSRLGGSFALPARPKALRRMLTDIQAKALEAIGVEVSLTPYHKEA